jgi:hypothetical protein
MKEHRTVRTFLLDHARRRFIEETVGLDAAGAEIMLIEETLHAGRGLEAARAHEGAERG